MNFFEFHFIRPYWLLALLPLVILSALSLRRRLSQGHWASVCDAELLPYLLQDTVARSSRWPATVMPIAALLAIVAMAGPTWERLPVPVFRNDSALVIALDLSDSMNAEDIKPSRLIRARYKIADMLKQRKDGQTALLVFSGDAFTVTPLTNDTETIASQLDALTTDIMPTSGRNTAAVLRQASSLFKQAGLRKGRIVLITDNVDLENTLPAMKTLDTVSLSVLAVGTEDGAPIPLPGGGGFVKDSQGSIIVPKLNAGNLIELAAAGRGRYQSLTANDADIRSLLAEEDSAQHQTLEQQETPMTFELWEDKGPWLVLLVLPLAALSFRKGLLAIAFLLVLPFPESAYALNWQDLWLTKDQQAARAYEQKQFDQAAELFENPDWRAAALYKSDIKEPGEMKTPKTATGFYNQGNVLAKSGRLEEAITAYDKALVLDPDNGDAQYNKELVEQELEKQKNQQDQQNQQQPDDHQSKQKEGSDQQQQDSSEQDRNSEENESQSPERSEETPEHSDENKADDSAQQQQEQEPDQKPSGQAEQEQKDDLKEKEPPQESAVPARPTDEQLQANEQWLNRIPDDPAGLLRRKFEYQYSQRKGGNR